MNNYIDTIDTMIKEIKRIKEKINNSNNPCEVLLLNQELNPCLLTLGSLYYDEETKKEKQ